MKRNFMLFALIAFASECTLHAALVINEVCYENSTVQDETGDASSDWIELYNSGPADINVNGYGVGDANPYDENKGVRLPDYTIPAGGYLLIFANSDLPEYTAWIPAPDAAAIPENSSWKYWHESSAPAGSWTAPAYADAAWAAGISPLGYNAARANMDCATLIGDTTNPATLHRTAYFRRKFTILKPAVVTNLLLRARIKDGAVLYLNGTEITRWNMPLVPVSYSTLASAPVSSTTWTTLALDPSLLVRGENTLAVEVHKASATGTALIMDLSLTALVDELMPVVHAQFGLKKDGEKCHLFDASLSRIDACDGPGYEIGANKSWGTVTDGVTSSFQTYDTPTPGFSNTTYAEKYRETLISQQPLFSVAPGFYATAQSVFLSTPTAGYRIFYTLDGSDPRDSTTFIWSGNSVAVSEPADATEGLAFKRTSPLETAGSVSGAGWLPPAAPVDSATVLRAIAVSSDNLHCSPETRGTYFIGNAYQNRTLPVFSLTTEEAHLFGFADGLYLPGKHYGDSAEGYGSNKWGKPYANYHQENTKRRWERPLYFEFFEPGQNTAAVSAPMGFAMHGGGTRALPQKALYMLGRDGTYGTDYVNYPLFPDSPLTRYKRFLLRCSGNDWYGAASAGMPTMLRDAVMHDIASSLKISVMAARPALVYINGAYWGIHNLRESYDKHYLAEHYAIDPDNADIVSHLEQAGGKIAIISVAGDSSADNEYEAMLKWIQLNPLYNAANYQQITNQIDAENFTDYIIAETFFANTDWPQNNCDFWRAHENQVDVAGEYGDTRWRWMLYDLDVAGEQGAGFNMFSYLTGSGMTAVDEPAFLINQLWVNTDFRNGFILRYADMLNTAFRPSHTSNTVATAALRVADEIETHFSRWGRSITQAQWQNAVNAYLRDYLADRCNNSWTHLDAHFGLGGTGTLTLRNNDPSGSGGHLKVNSITLTAQTDGVDNPADWTGTFFRSLPVSIKALPAPGCEFDGWVGSTVTSPERSVMVGAQPTTLVARFRAAGAPPYAAAGYEVWLLNNYTEQEINQGTATAPNAPSGKAGMSNFDLYAFGMAIGDGLSDAQRRARASLSLNAEATGLYVGYNRLNDTHADIGYTLRATDALAAPTLWRDAIPGQDYLTDTITNVLDGSTWFLQRKLNPGGKETLFFKLEVRQQ